MAPDHGLETQVAAVLTEHLSQWTFDGSEPCCVELAALLSRGTPTVRELRAAFGDAAEVRPLVPLKAIDALLALDRSS